MRREGVIESNSQEHKDVFKDGLLLGSSSPHKLEAVQSACVQLGLKLDISPAAAESEINAQPFGFEETYTGALNRARNVQIQNPQKPALGIESGIIPIGDKYIDLAVVVVLMPDGHIYMSTSAGIEFPRAAVDAARLKGFANITAGSMIAETMGGSSTDPHSFLTGGKLSRKDLLSQAIATVLSQALSNQK